MPEIRLSIPGVPNSQKRHRHLRVGNFTRSYDPSSTEKEDFLYKSIYENKPAAPITKPISLLIFFYMPRPKSHYGTGKNSGILKKTAPLFHTNTPDIDNMQKFVLDSLNHVYWKDDKQIYNVSAEKLYDENPRTEIHMFWGL